MAGAQPLAPAGVKLALYLLAKNFIFLIFHQFTPARRERARERGGGDAGAGVDDDRARVARDRKEGSTWGCAGRRGGRAKEDASS